MIKILFHYACTGLIGCGIGEFMALDYSTVSVGRKRLRKKLNNASLKDLFKRISVICQQ